jgi:hypothetical protein
MHASDANKMQRLIWILFANPDTSTSYVDVRSQAECVAEWPHRLLVHVNWKIVSKVVARRWNPPVFCVKIPINPDLVGLIPKF